MPDIQRQLVDLPSLLKDNGIVVKSVEDDGSYNTIDIETGEESRVDPFRVINNLGLDQNKYDIQINDPTTAVDKSPVSFADRARLSVGNKEESFNFLKKNYGEVAYDSNKGFTVKENGLWKSVDPSFLGEGTAWEKTQELAADAIDFLPTVGKIAATGLAVAALPATAGIAATLAATGIASAGGSIIETSLGRLAGTYTDSFAEQAHDAMLETLLSAGGVAVGAGAKAGIDSLGKALSKINVGVSSGSKELMAELGGKVMGIPSSEVARGFGRAPQITNILKSATESARAGGKLATDDTVKAVINRGYKEQLGKMLSEAPKKLQSNFGKMLDDIDARIPASTTFNVSDDVALQLNQLERLGLVTKSGNIWKTQTTENIDKALTGGTSPQILLDANTRNLQKFVRMSNQVVAKGKSLSWKEVRKLRQTLDDFVADTKSLTFNAETGGGALDDVLSQNVAGFRQSLVGKLRGVSDDVANRYDEMNRYYANNIDAANSARAIMSNPNRLDVVASLYSKRGADTYVHRQIDQLAKNVFNDKTGAMLDGINDFVTASHYTKTLPSLGVVSAAATAGALGAGFNVISPAAATALSAGGLAASSPRIALGAGKLLSNRNAELLPDQIAKPLIPGLTNLRRFMKSISGDDRVQALNNPGTAGALFSQAFQGLQDQ